MATVKKVSNGLDGLVGNIMLVFFIGLMCLWFLGRAMANLDKPIPIWSDNHIVGFETPTGVVEMDTPTFNMLIKSYEKE